MDTLNDITTDAANVAKKVETTAQTVETDVRAVVAKAMNPTVIDRLKTQWAIIKSKWPLYALFVFLGWIYLGIPAVKVSATGEVTGGWPFSDVVFALLAVVGVPALASLIQALAFEAAANYGVNGALKADVPTPGISNAYIHWAFTTFISYAVAFGLILLLHH